mmetsp:Transcript_24607/g.56363  ORF Transcript_24607/g.56363 Transcript_24607/m.56363 type:complete len:100 (+) Transcript_24607:1833-2132(+)
MLVECLDRFMFGLFTGGDTSELKFWLGVCTGDVPLIREWIFSPSSEFFKNDLDLMKELGGDGDRTILQDFVEFKFTGGFVGVDRTLFVEYEWHISAGEF